MGFADETEAGALRGLSADEALALALEPGGIARWAAWRAAIRDEADRGMGELVDYLAAHAAFTRWCEEHGR